MTQLDGSTVSALEFGKIDTMPYNKNYSTTMAYLLFTIQSTVYLKSLSISTYDGLKISFPSLPQPSFKIIINS
jgi:hypothetical protein